VVNQTLVFQIKFCGKSPALRVAAKRYRQPLTKRQCQYETEDENIQGILQPLFWHICFCPIHKTTLRKNKRAKICQPHL